MLPLARRRPQHRQLCLLGSELFLCQLQVDQHWLGLRQKDFVVTVRSAVLTLRLLIRVIFGGYRLEGAMANHPRYLDRLLSLFDSAQCWLPATQLRLPVANVRCVCSRKECLRKEYFHFAILELRNSIRWELSFWVLESVANRLERY